jgi:hypothetical protein
MIIRAFLTASLLLTALPLRAVERYLKIEAVPTAQPGQNYRATIKAGTDAGGGEQIGMFQVDISVDDGRTWTGARYLDGLGASTTQGIDIPIGPTTTPVRLRVRVAFRGGLAGDVDFRGAAIRWQESWANWEEPPAQSVRIAVKAP